MRIQLLFMVCVILACQSKPNANKTKKEKLSIVSTAEKYLTQTNKEIASTSETPHYTLQVKQKIKASFIKETYLVFHTKNASDTLFNELRKWLNGQLYLNKNNSKLLNWTKKDKEYLLYKQDDSTIFVNIFNKGIK